MTEDASDLVRRLHREEVERLGHPMRPPPPERPTLHYTELAPALPGSPIATEWEVYRREVGRLLALGHEGHWVLIKGEQIIGVWPTEAEADQVRLQRFLMEPVLIKQVLTREPILRIRGYNLPWPS